MERECLEFFKQRTKDETLELFNIKNKTAYLEFTIQNPGSSYGHTCVTLRIYRNLSLMIIELVRKCSLTGTQNMTTAIEFAKEHLIRMIQLLDASSIDYTLSTGESKSINFKHISMLEKANTWYERLGFRNNFDQYRDHWVDCIQKPFPVLYDSLKVSNDLNDLLAEHIAYFKDPEKIYKYTETSVDAPIHILFSRILVFLQKNCPKENENKCNPSINDHDFTFLEGFVEKSFQVLMLVVHLKHGSIQWFRQLAQVIKSYDQYYMMLYLPNDAPVVLHGMRTETMNGLKGKIVNVTKERYRVELEDKRTADVKFENVKLLEAGGKRNYRKSKKNKSRNRSNKRL